MLTRSNYSEWTMLMQCNYEAMEIWEVIEPGGAGVKRTQDHQAMGADSIICTKWMASATFGCEVGILEW